MYVALFRQLFRLSRPQVYLLTAMVSLGTLFLVVTVGYAHYSRPLLIAFVPSIFISAMVGGLVPGLISTVVAAIGPAYFYFAPRGSLLVESPRDLIQLSILIFSALLVSFLSEILHRAMRRLEMANAELAISEARFRRLADLAPVGIDLTDAQGRCVFANPKWLEMAGVPLEEALGHGWTQALHPGDRESVSQAWERMVSSAGDWGLAYRFRTPDGKVSWVQGVAAAIPDEKGGAAGYVGVNMDITEMWEARRRIEESEARFRSIVAVVPVGVVLQGADGRIMTWNQAMEGIFGISEDEVVGRDARSMRWETFRPDGSEWPGGEHPSAVTLETGRPLRDQVMRVVSPVGEEHWISVSTQPLFHSGQAKPYAVTIAVNDITSRKREEKFRDDVERIIRHDIKTPLISIFSMAQLAKMGRLEALDEMIPRLETGIQQVLRLVDSSGKLRLMERGIYVPRLERLDVGRVMETVRNTLECLARERGVRLQTRSAPGPPGPDGECAAEPALVEDMLVNLVKNAVEASPAGGTVSVVQAVEDGMCAIRIRNMGAVPEAVRERFFEMDVTFGKSGGAGLGTYSAMLMARAHGGTIELDSSEEGATTVTVRLPCGRSAPR